MRERIFRWIARTVVRYSKSVFFLGLILTVVMGILAAKIRLDVNWRALIPENSASTKNFEKILDEFGAATQIVVAIEGLQTQDIIHAARELVPLFEQATYEQPGEDDGPPVVRNVLRQVDVSYDTSFIAAHGLMLVKAKNLEKNYPLYTDYNLVPFIRHINDVLETQYVQDSDNLTKQEKEAVRGLDGIYQFMDALYAFAAGESTEMTTVQTGVNALTIGDGYYLSTDKKMLLMFLTPTMSVDQMDTGLLAVNRLDEIIGSYERQHSDFRIGMTGMHVVARDEMEAGVSDAVNNLVVALVFILFVFVISFRMLTGPLLAMIVLLAGITWDIGIAYLFIGRLNIFTAVCSVILVGLGVDYAIHIISAYTEFRRKGQDVEQAMTESFTKIGPGLITGAITTATAFLTLVFTSYPAFQEFGFVVGTGIISCLVASLFLLPSMLVMKEAAWSKIRKEAKPKAVNLEFTFLGTTTGKIARFPKTVIILTGLLTLIFIMSIPRVYMNRNYMDMEPEGLESVRLQREIPRRFNMSPDNMMTVVSTLKEADRLTDLLNERPSVGLVGSVTEYLPSPEKQARRIPFITKIAAEQRNLPAPIPLQTGSLIEELYRLNDNLTEMSSLAFISGLDKVFDKINHYLGLNEEGDQVGTNRVDALIEAVSDAPGSKNRLASFQRAFIPLMRDRITMMANPGHITLDMIPRNVRAQYVSSNGEHFLIYIYSKRDIWDGLFTTPFLDTVIRDVPAATGSPVFMSEMVTLAKEEGTFALLLALITIMIILLIDFRSVKIAVVAVLPLCLALIWMVGIMGLTGFPFSIVNVIGLPLILGIGIDDGVHIIHRYRIEGRQKLAYSLSSIGKAITLTTLTTVLGFGSLIPSSYRGYASLGTLVTLGISLCFVISIFVLPAFLVKFVDSKK